MIIQILTISIALFASTSFAATGLRTAAFTYDYEGAALDESTHADIHVLCDDCPKKQGLTKTPVLPRLEARFTEPVAPPAEVPLVSIAEPEPIVVKAHKEKKILTVLFALESSHLQAKERSAIAKTVRKIKPNLEEGAKLRVHGYTCDLGSKKINNTLANKRAGTVAKALTELGVKPEQIIGSGKCCYVSTNKTLNRRVEITLVPRRSE